MRLLELVISHQFVFPYRFAVNNYRNLGVLRISFDLRSRIDVCLSQSINPVTYHIIFWLTCLLVDMSSGRYLLRVRIGNFLYLLGGALMSGYSSSFKAFYL